MMTSTRLSPRFGGLAIFALVVGMANPPDATAQTSVRDVTPTLLGPTLYPYTVNPMTGSRTYTKLAAGTKPQVGKPLVVVFDFEADPTIPAGDHSQFAKTRALERILTAGGGAVPANQKDIQSPPPGPTPALILNNSNFNETKTISIEFTPAYTGRYRVEFQCKKTDPDSWYRITNELIGGVWTMVRNRLLETNFSTDIDIDP
jgi:hypothetical protein